MAILDERDRLMPVEYEWAYETYLAMGNSSWLHTEVQMQADVIQWPKLLQVEREVIASILLGFTQLEQPVGCYWREIVAANFKKPELVFLATLCSNQESVHAYAYNHLEATLGLDTYDSFMANAVAQAKLANYKKVLSTGKQTPAELAISLAVFSGLCESVSLFGSFAILLSMSKDAQLIGTKQILSWSVRDEDMHGQIGLRLYNELIADYPEAKPNSDMLIALTEDAVNCELAFIGEAFEYGGKQMREITFEQASVFTKSRANMSLSALGLRQHYAMPAEGNTVAEWFYPLVKTTTLGDFFAYGKNGAGYASKLIQDFMSVDLTQFKL